MVSTYDTANLFRQLMRDAGLHGVTFDVMAEKLVITESYVKTLWSGKDPVSSPIRAKLDALIAAKRAGPVGFTPTDPNPPDPVEQFEVDLPAESLLDQHVRKSTGLEAQLAKHVDPRTYKVFTDPDGRGVVTKVIARFTSIRDADEYVLFLNEQIRRGKGGG